MITVTGNGGAMVAGACIQLSLPEAAQEQFAALLAYETDCADVHHAVPTGHQDFVLFDVRSEELFASWTRRGGPSILCHDAE